MFHRSKISIPVKGVGKEKKKEKKDERIDVIPCNRDRGNLIDLPFPLQSTVL